MHESARRAIFSAMEEAEAYSPPGAALPTVAHDRAAAPDQVIGDGLSRTNAAAVMAVLRTRSFLAPMRVDRYDTPMHRVLARRERFKRHLDLLRIASVDAQPAGVDASPGRISDLR